MKKRLFVIMAALLFTLTGCGKETTYHEVSYDELNKMIKDKESFVLVIGSETCSACESYKPTMEKIISKYNIRINYINVYPLTQEQKAGLLQIVYYANTPTTVYFEKGKPTETYKHIVGAASYDKVLASLKENGYIK